MKIDPNQKLTIGARRTLLQLQKELERMLAEKDFSDIQVTELCERTMIPKSTFYHYFEDKFGILSKADLSRVGRTARPRRKSPGDA